MMKHLKTLLAGAVVAMSVQSASAAVVFADSVVGVAQGSCNVVNLGAGETFNGNGCADSRSDPNAALGAPDGTFFSLGFGGELEVSFPGSAPFESEEGTVYELTFDRDIGHDEAVEVFAILDGAATSLGVVTNTVAANSFSITGMFDTILFLDVTLETFASTTSFDGFDIDAISISAVPLPATGLMLLGGLAGFGAMRRKKKA